MNEPASPDIDKKLPDDVNNLLQVTQALTASDSQTGASTALLGLCTSIVDRQVVDKLGPELEVICKRCGINSAETPMGYVLYGSVCGLQQVERFIQESKTKSEDRPLKAEKGGRVKIIKDRKKHTSSKVTATSDISTVDDDNSDISPPDSPQTNVSHIDKTSIKLDLSTAVQLSESSLAKPPSTLSKNDCYRKKETLSEKNSIPKPAKRAKIEEKDMVKMHKEPNLFELDPVKIVAKLLNKHEATITGSYREEQAQSGENESMDNAFSEHEEMDEPLDIKKEAPSKVKLQAIDLNPSDSSSNPDFHVCLKCSYYGYSRLSLKRHMKRMHDSVLCDYCQECFDSASAMEQHAEEKHSGEEKPPLKPPKKKPKTKNEQNKSEKSRLKKCKMVKCCFCSISLPTTKLVEMHMKKIHSEQFEEIKNDLQFDIVEKDLSEGQDSLLDTNTVWGEKLQQCPYCALKSSNPGAFKQHVAACKTRDKADRTTIKKRLTVDEMAEIFEVPMELLEDMISDYPNVLKHKFHCDYCGYISTKQGVCRHVLRTHSGPANIVCKYCHQKFRKEWELRSHNRSHFDKKGLLKVKTLKNNPELVDKANDNSVDYQCDVCTLHLSSENLLEVHKIRHHFPEKGWQCLICELVFCEMSSLKTHVLSHFTQMRVNKDTEGSQDKKPKYTWKKRESSSGSFLCEQCGTGFKSEKTLKNHRIKCPTLTANYQISYTEMGYIEEELMKAADLYPTVAKYIHPCPHCSYTSTLKGIEKHVVRSHRKMNFQCAHCPRQFAREWHVKEHLRVSHRQIELDASETTGTGEAPVAVKPSVTVTCSECNYVCAKRGIAVHELYHKKDWNLRCVVCKRNLPSIEMMSQHLADHFNPSTGQLIVPKCSKGYGEEDLVKYNKSINIMFADEEGTEQTPRLCEECGLSFASVTKLKHHMRSHNSERANRYEVVSVEEEVVYECTCPGGNCVSNCYETVQHRRVVKYKCPREGCGSLHLKPSYVVKHLREVHVEEGPIQCQFCDRNYSHVKNLKVHIRKDHYKELDHGCNVCGKLFYDSSKLNYHMDTHLPKSERSDASACKICGKVLVKKYLKQHINSHTGRKPYKCKVCDRAFPYATGLNRHMLHVHSKEAPFVCDVCGRAFKIAAKLRYHKTIHTGVSKHKCEQCNTVFTQLSSLKKHQQYHCIELEDSKRTQRLSSLLDSQEAKLKIDLMDHHPTEDEQVQQVFMCSVCNITFTEFVEIEAHVLTHEAKQEQPQQEVNIFSQMAPPEGEVAPVDTQNASVLQEVHFVDHDMVPKAEATTYYTQSADGQETYLVASYQ